MLGVVSESGSVGNGRVGDGLGGARGVGSRARGRANILNGLCAIMSISVSSLLVKSSR